MFRAETANENAKFESWTRVGHELDMGLAPPSEVVEREAQARELDFETLER